MNNNQLFTSKTMAYCGIGIVLATVLNFISIEMPMGGSATFCSMLFVSILGYWFGPLIGILSGLAYGLVNLMIEPYIVSIPQVILDYFLAFGCLGITGFFRNRKNGLVIGYLAAITGRYFCAVLSGIIFFGMYAPDGMNPLLYSIIYNGIYIYAEGILTLFVITTPVFRDVFERLKVDVINEQE